MIIADTGFFVALANQTDSYHEIALSIMAKINEPIITTFPVITETCYFLVTRRGNFAQCAFLRNFLSNSFEIFTLEKDHIARMIELLELYSDLPMDMADASIVVLAEYLNQGRILTTDVRDFNVYRWNNRHHFENLLLR